MPTSPPAEIGARIDEIDTPALVLDLDAFEQNVDRMSTIMNKSRVRLRPHAKTHKSPIIALRQIGRGAVGVCCQKVSEAEAMVYGGVRDILLTNQVVNPRKLRRLMALAKEARIAVCADNAENVVALSNAAVTVGIELPVLVEVNIGMQRCGVEPGEPVLGLAKAIVSSPGLRFAGLQAYQGAAQQIRDFVRRRDAIRTAAAQVSATVDLLAQHDLHCELVTGAGTGTFNFEIESGIFNEIQAGSYVFMDADYAKNRMGNETPFDMFRQALFVCTTVMSRPSDNRAVVDAGLKSLSTDQGMPLVKDKPDISYVEASDEHGTLMLDKPGATPALGEQLWLIPGHCDPTVNLFDWYVGVRGQTVESLWPVAARGAVQ